MLRKPYESGFSRTSDNTACERCDKIDQQIVLEKIKNLMLSWLPFLKLKGLLAAENPNFQKFVYLKNTLYANLRSLNDYGLIISIKANKKAYVCICFILKIGDATSTRIYFPISVHHISVFVYPIKKNRKAYVCVCFISKIGDTTSAQIYFPILALALK